LIARLPELARLGFPILAGPSRKGFIGRTLGGVPESERTYGTAAAVTACILQGAHIVRVHDVREMAQVARVADMLVSPKLRHGSRP
jgi:dihydropteroate synthase